MTLHNHNGTLVIHNPEGEYDYQALVEEWKDKMDELPDLPVDLEEYKADLCSQIEARKDPIMLAGFDYNGKTVRADSEAQANLTAWIVRDGRGGLSYPKNWILPDGTLLQINSSTELDALADAFEDFKERVYTAIVTGKAQIIASSTVSQAKAIFDTWESSLA